VGQHGLQHMRVVIDAELVGDGEQHRIRFRDGFVGLQLLDQLVGFVGVGAPLSCGCKATIAWAAN
jgi:hypothetical protein